MSKATDCGQLPFKTAEANAKAWMRSEGFINGALYITAAPEEKEKEFERIAEALKKRGKEKYGITADWIQMAGDGFIVVNRAAFKACDMLNGLYYKNEVNGYPYYRQVKPYKKKRNKGNNNQEELGFSDEAEVPDEEWFSTKDYDDDLQPMTEEDVPKSGLTKLINLKKKLLTNAEAQLNRVQNLIKDNKGNKALSKKLRIEAEALKIYINGTEQLKDPLRLNIGLIKEIEELKKIDNKDPRHFEYYIENMLKRLETITKSQLTYELGEALEIIEFIIAMNDFDYQNITMSNMGHPVYDSKELFEMSQQNKKELDELRENYYSKWAARALDLKNQLFLSEKKAIENMVNQDKIIQKMFGGKEFTYEEIVEAGSGMKDINWLDMMLMDITAGIFSHNGILPQIISKVFRDFLSTALVEQRLLESALQQTVGPAEEALMELDDGDHRLAGILGTKGVSWSIFWQKDKNGSPRPVLVNKYSREWDIAYSEMESRYRKRIDESYGKAKSKYLQIRREAYQKKNKWLRSNTILVNPAYLPELWENNEENKELRTLYKYFPSTEEEKAEAQRHKEQLIAQVGTKYYEKLVKEQREKLHEYVTQRDVMTDMYRINLGLPETFPEEDFDDEIQQEIKEWESNYNPFISVTFQNSKFTSGKDKGKYSDRSAVYSEGEHDYFSFYTFNLHVPLRNKEKESTGYYDQNYQKIEDGVIVDGKHSDALMKFYEVASEGLDNIMRKFDMETQRNMPNHMIFFMEQSIQEKIFQKSKMDPNYRLAEKLQDGLTNIFDFLKTKMGVRIEDSVSSATINTITGLPEYKVNDSFIKQGTYRMQELFKLNAIEFLQKYKQIMKSEHTAINGNTHMALFPKVPAKNRAMAALISPYIGKNITAEEMIKKFGDRLPIGKILEDFSQHQLVQEQSYDLPKILRYFGHAAAEYSARNESLPFTSFLKRHYESIKNFRTNNVGSPMKNEDGGSQLEGLRTHAVRQHDAWFRRVILGDYSLKKHFGVVNPPEEKDPNDTSTGIAKSLVSTMTNRGIGRKMLTARELALSNRLERMIAAETEQEVRDKLIKMKSNLGRTVAVSAILDSLADFLRFKGLGYNLSSGITNLLEGQLANSLTASLGTWFPTEYIDTITLTEIVASDFKKRTTGKGIDKVEMAQHLMEHWDVLQDASNELQRATMKSSLSVLSKYTPYYLQTKTESYNQIPLIAAILRDTKIKGSDGETEGNVWEALEWDAENQIHRLKDEFRTTENINNWELSNGEEFNAFQVRIADTIKNTHGDFDQFSGMMIKESIPGKIVMLFKTWLPREIWKRFAVEQVNLTSGVVHKGRYRSLTPVSAGILGIAGFMVPFGLPAGIMAGGVFALASRLRGPQSSISLTQEIIESTKLLTRKMLGFPVNYVSRIVGKGNIIDVHPGQELYDKMKSDSFTAQDYANWKANMDELSFMFAFWAMLLFVKGLTWDDDDDKDSKRRRAHNLMINKLMQVSSSMYQYSNPIALKDMAVNLSIFQFLDSAFKAAQNFDDYVNGTDIYTSGPLAGESKFEHAVERMFLPNIAKSPFTLGFEPLMEQQYQHLPLDKWFWSDEKLAKSHVTMIRSQYRVNLIKEGKSKDEADDLVNKKYPKKKKGESYVDLLDKYGK